MASGGPRLTFDHKPVSIHGFCWICRNGNGVEWDSVVCHKGTVRPAVLWSPGARGTAFAQTAPDWRKVGGSAVDLALAAPATGPVDQVWFSPGGSALLARTRSGKSTRRPTSKLGPSRHPLPKPRHLSEHRPRGCLTQAPGLSSRPVIPPGFMASAPALPLRRWRTHLGESHRVPLESDRRNRAAQRRDLAR